LFKDFQKAVFVHSYTVKVHICVYCCPFSGEWSGFYFSTMLIGEYRVNALTCFCHI